MFTEGLDFISRCNTQRLRRCIAILSVFSLGLLFGCSDNGGGGGSNPGAATPPAPTELSNPNFFTLTAAQSGVGAGTIVSNPTGINCGASCAAAYARGLTVTLTATANTGSSFQEWKGDCVATVPSITLTMDANKSCTAVFNPLPPFIISGNATFGKRLVNNTGLTNIITNTPIRFADIEVFREAGGAVVASGDTDKNGDFHIAVPSSEIATPLRVRVMARQVNAMMNVRVVDAVDDNDLITGALYAVTSDARTGPQTDLRLLATLDNATGRRAGAFNIFDVFIRATEFVNATTPARVYPPVVFLFKLNLNKGVFFVAKTVFLEGQAVDEISIGDAAADTNDFDDSVIFHEIGHYMIHNFSKDSSPGGPHSLGQRLDPRLAFSEGAATFFGQAVLGDSLYVDSGPLANLTFSVETSKLGMASTYESEDAVSQVLWDLFDSGGLSIDADPLAMGFASLWKNGFVALRSPQARFVYLHTLLDQLKTANLLTSGNINTISCASPLLVCDPPFNNRFTPSQPVPFPARTIGGNATLSPGPNCVCTVTVRPGQAAQETLAEASDFYLLELPSPGTLTITLTVTSPNADDLDLFLLEDDQGQPVVNPVTGATESGNETITTALPAGKYMIHVNGFSTKASATQLISYTLKTMFQ